MRLRAVLSGSLMAVLVAAGSAATPASASPTPALETTILAPVVVLPSMVVPMSVGIGNDSKLPTTVTVKFHGWCWDVKSARIDFSSPPVTWPVPGDPNRIPGTTVMARVPGVLTIPSACVAQPDVPGIPTQDGIFWADTTLYGHIPGSFSSLFWIGKPFNLANIRYNLDLKTHQTPADSQAHHTLPQAFRAKFTAADINIDDPAQLRWWCSKPGVPTNHQSKASDYTARWKAFFDKNPKATKAQILAFRDSIQKFYVYACPGVSNYPGFP